MPFILFTLMDTEFSTYYMKMYDKKSTTYIITLISFFVIFVSVEQRSLLG